MKTKKIVNCAVLTSIGILLPFIFHFAIPIKVGNFSLGQWLLPIHYGAIFAGCFFGPFAGIIVGIFTPLLSNLLTGMPQTPMVYFITAEIVVYGLVTGVLFYKYQINIYLTLLITFVLGRITLLSLSFYFGKIIFGKAFLFTTTVQLITIGIIGEIIQLIIIPIIIKRINIVYKFNK